jgi:uncharacterized protein
MRFFPHQIAIDFLGQGGFRFGEMSHQGALLSLPQGMFALEGLSLENLMPALNSPIDFLLIGSGEKRVPLDKSLQAAFRARAISVENMTTAQAVSTYNVLLNEKRRVGAAFMAV